MGTGASSSSRKVRPASEHLDVSDLLEPSHSRGFSHFSEASCAPKPPGDAPDPSETSVEAKPFLVPSPVPLATDRATKRHQSAPAGHQSWSNGELFLLLERVNGVSGQGISVKALVQLAQAGEDGNETAAIGCVAEWPPRSCNKSPSWFSARSLGLRGVQHDPDALALRIELWDRRRLLGSLTEPLSGLDRNVRETRPLASTAARSLSDCTVSFHIVDAALIQERHSVFFIRHAESIWNEAKKKMNLRKMAGTTDHSLSIRGCEQAEDLDRRLRACAQHPEEAVKPMLQPDAVFVSPLTRAVQTAVIALGPSLAKDDRPGELMLMAAAREKQNRGGFDTRSVKLGSKIPQHVWKELQAKYRNNNEHVLDCFRQLRFDVQEVEDRWWFEGAAESQAQLDKRLEEFVAQLLYSPHRSIIVVGHSHFFRSLMRGFLCDDFKHRCSDLADSLTNKKLQNCGVVRLELETSRGITGQPIVDATPVLRSKLELERALTIGSAGSEPVARGILEDDPDEEFSEDEEQPTLKRHALTEPIPRRQCDADMLHPMT